MSLRFPTRGCGGGPGGKRCRTLPRKSSFQAAMRMIVIRVPPTSRTDPVLLSSCKTIAIQSSTRDVEMGENTEPERDRVEFILFPVLPCRRQCENPFSFSYVLTQGRRRRDELKGTHNPSHSQVLSSRDQRVISYTYHGSRLAPSTQNEMTLD